MKAFPLRSIHLALIALLGLGSGCDSSSSNSNAGASHDNGTPSAAPTWSRGHYPPSDQLAGYCVNPRAGGHPLTGEPFGDRQGTLMHEKMWLRSAMHELYLWSSDQEDPNPAGLELEPYFTRLTVPGDWFSFSWSLPEYLSGNQGVHVDYGIQWAFEGNVSAGTIRVADVAASSPYHGQLERGDVVVELDGIRIDEMTEQEHPLVLQGLYPTEAGEVHAFVFARAGAEPVERTLTASEVEYDTVPRYHAIATQDGLVGYLQFNQHLAKSEGELIDAITDLYNQGVSDLILDLRYNGGGYLDVASELAYMIAGPGRTMGQAFYQPRFNEQWGETDPFTGQTSEPIPFHTSTVLAEAGPSQDLPSLNLSRVFVLTGPETCSASEAIINGLRGIDVEVFQFGSASCGKPYGGIALENCGTVYNLVMFRGTNAKGYGDYRQGFVPGGSVEQGGDEHLLPGCNLPDDLNHALGDKSEGLLAAALHFRETGACPATAEVQVQALFKRQLPVLKPARARAVLHHRF